MSDWRAVDTRGLALAGCGLVALTVVALALWLWAFLAEAWSLVLQIIVGWAIAILGMQWARG